MRLKQIPALLRATYNQWSTDNCLRFGAALAFYAFSSLIPLLVIVLISMTFVLHFTGGGRISNNNNCMVSVGWSTTRSWPTRSRVA